VPAGLAEARTKHASKSGRSARRETSAKSFHSLRHSFVSVLKAVGGTQAVAKELAGHSSDMVSDGYTKLPIETLTAAVKQLPEIR
jgi:site-specific recombinase XerD